MASVWTWHRHVDQLDYSGGTTPAPWAYDQGYSIQAPDSLQRVIVRCALTGYATQTGIDSEVPALASGVIICRAYLGPIDDGDDVFYGFSPLAAQRTISFNGVTNWQCDSLLWTVAPLDFDVRARKAAPPMPDPGFILSVRVQYRPDTIYVGAGRQYPNFQGFVSVAYLTSRPGL